MCFLSCCFSHIHSVLRRHVIKCIFYWVSSIKLWKALWIQNKSYLTYHIIKFQLSWTPWRRLQLFQNCAIWMLQYTYRTKIRYSKCFNSQFHKFNSFFLLISETETFKQHISVPVIGKAPGTQILNSFLVVSNCYAPYSPQTF